MHLNLKHESEIITPSYMVYEPVDRMIPTAEFIRPIVLIGPSGIGRNELKRRLILYNPKKYASTVPHTSRSQRLKKI